MKLLNSDLLSEIASDLGFDAIGFSEFSDHKEEKKTLQVWLEDGRHSSMKYMEKRVTSYGSPGLVFPEAIGVLMVIFKWPKILVPEREPWILWVASFARGPDYHGIVKQKLKTLKKYIGGESFRSFVDSSPFCERGLAMRAGLGWIGKNRYLLHPGIGGDIGIGEIVVDRRFDTAISSAAAGDMCGECRACIKACPTGALTQKGLDARLCLGYLTAEHRRAVPLELRSRIGTRMFGCDECLAACPYGKIDLPEEKERNSDFPLSILTIDSNRAFRSVFRDSPFYRLGRKATMRNAMIILGNLKEERAIGQLYAIARSDPSVMLREQAIWSLGSMDTRKTRFLVKSFADNASGESERKTARHFLDHTTL